MQFKANKHTKLKAIDDPEPRFNTQSS
uniref:Uncharacterized protein n=1 Tax=Rhizophora mucronata TaxID=61149 RepID=A0A2P2N5U5_RHIMU